MLANRLWGAKRRVKYDNPCVVSQVSSFANLINCRSAALAHPYKIMHAAVLCSHVLDMAMLDRHLADAPGTLRFRALHDTRTEPAEHRDKRAKMLNQSDSQPSCASSSVPTSQSLALDLHLVRELRLTVERDEVEFSLWCVFADPLDHLFLSCLLTPTLSSTRSRRPAQGRPAAARARRVGRGDGGMARAAALCSVLRALCSVLCALLCALCTVL